MKAVLFDVHGTLVVKGPREALDAAQNAIVDYLSRHGFAVTLERYRQALADNAKRFRRDVEELNEVGFYQWYECLLADLGIPLQDRDWIDRLNEEFGRASAATAHPMPHALEVLSQLRRAYRLGVVSNSMAPNTRRDLAVAGLADAFDSVVISTDVGKRKPHPYIFNLALANLGVTAEEAVFVGDHPIEDIAGAKRVGMKAILIQSPSRADTRWSELRRGDSALPPAEPDATIEDLAELPDAIARV
ncbi:MAG: HAD family hydrolase [Chloroflexi bacterium]|nr:HAD family hydrolase [Chloroflexota bacterium]